MVQRTCSLYLTLAQLQLHTMLIIISMPVTIVTQLKLFFLSYFYSVVSHLPHLQRFLLVTPVFFFAFSLVFCSPTSVVIFGTMFCIKLFAFFHRFWNLGPSDLWFVLYQIPYMHSVFFSPTCLKPTTS